MAQLTVTKLVTTNLTVTAIVPIGGDFLHTMVL